jgi:hypothetical protein
LRDDPADGSDPADNAIRAVLWRDRVLVLELREWLSEFEDVAPQLALFDVGTGMPFRYFAGDRHCRGLPLLWQRVDTRPLDMDLRTSPP